MDGNRRVSWRGGNILNNGDVMTLRAVQDVLLDDLYIEGGLSLHRRAGREASHRVAIVNSTLDTSMNNVTQFTIFSQQDSGIEKYSDLIFANVQAHNGYNSPFRLQHAERIVVVDSAFNPRNTSGTGFRFSVGCDSAYVADTIIVGRIHLTYLDYADAGITNVHWERIQRYTVTGANALAFANTNSTDSGVLDSPRMYTNRSDYVGRAPMYSPFTGVSVPTFQQWTSLPDVSRYGARR